jgi:hypothetical protein
MCVNWNNNSSDYRAIKTNEKIAYNFKKITFFQYFCGEKAKTIVQNVSKNSQTFISFE